MISQKRIDQIRALKGRVRGDVIVTDFKYVREKEGEKAMEKLNRELKKIEKDLDFYRIRNTAWLPISWKVLFLEVTKELFGWKEKDIFDLGRSASRNSFITRTLLRYFVSMEKTFKECPKYWKKYWQAGELEAYYWDIEQKYLIIRLKKFQIHPNLCIYLRGHFLAFAEMIIRGEKINIEETKCSFEGGLFHEFKVEWK